MLISAHCNDEIHSLIAHCESRGVDVRLIRPNRHWGGHKIYALMSEQDFFQVKLIYGNLYESVPYNHLEPYDDQEVEIRCHDCGVKVYSVSGWEWKQNPNLQQYVCKKTIRGECDYT